MTETTKARAKKTPQAKSEEQTQEVQAITAENTATHVVTSGYTETISPNPLYPIGVQAPYTLTYAAADTPEDDIILDHYAILSQINVKDYIEKKKTGNTELSYLSWANAWGELKRNYPDATYKILRFGENQLPYQYDDGIGYMCWTEMTIQGVTHMMWLPVMDGANKAMKNKPYKYFVRNYKDPSKPIEKTVDAADMFDINKTLMRCLVKNIGMFGLGLYIYSGEDLPIPPPDSQPEEQDTKQAKSATEPTALEQKIAAIHQKVLALTGGMEVKDKVVWAKMNIEPILGNVNYKVISDESLADKLMAALVWLENNKNKEKA